jgi:hypothetical protein
MFTEFQKRVLSLLLEIRDQKRTFDMADSPSLRQLTTMGEFEELEQSLQSAQEKQQQVCTIIP